VTRSPLTVAYDATAAATQRAGVGRATRDLLAALTERASHVHMRPFVVAPEITHPLPLGLPIPMHMRRSIRVARLDMLVRQTLRLPAHGPWDGADLYHATDIVHPPVARRLPVVSTVNDLSFIVFPEFHSALNARYLRLATPGALKTSRAVIAISQATKNDILRYTDIPEDKVHVVHIATPTLGNASGPTPEDLASVRETYDLPHSFILSVGTLEPRKNLAGVLSAYRMLRRNLGDAPPLVLVGGAGWKLDLGAAMASDIEPWIRRLGFVPDTDLHALYTACDAFVYPSFYEGWGLPVAEALSHGAPTITSNVSSLPEVVGDAALQVDPKDHDALATALEHVLTDKALADRLRAAGPPRAALFSTEAWVEGTLDAYRQADIG